MTNPTPHGQVPEALRLALSIDLMDTFTAYQQEELNKAAAELRSQHARIAELEAQIEASSGVQALSAAQAGWKTVPVNPTPEMWKAAKTVPDPNPPYPPHYGLVWDAMLAASPPPTSPAEQQAPSAAAADTVVLEAALRAIHQAIDLIGEPDTERLRTVRRVLRGAVIVAEDAGEAATAPQPSSAPQTDSQPAVQQWNDLIGKETHADADGLLVWRDEVDFAIPKPQTDSQPAPVLDRDRIREIFMAHGFTVKEGQTDLKQYVYDAAHALLELVAAPQQEAQEPTTVDKKTMELAESVGLIGPASRVGDLHAAIQRFHDLICVNATIKAAVMAADVISGVATPARDYPPLPMQFACSGVFPVYSADQMRAYVDADRAAYAPASSQPAPAPLSDDVVKDAARYRWLRDTSNADDPSHMIALHIRDEQNDASLSGIDAAIDETIAAHGDTP